MDVGDRLTADDPIPASQPLLGDFEHLFPPLHRSFENPGGRLQLQRMLERLDGSRTFVLVLAAEQRLRKGLDGMWQETG